MLATYFAVFSEIDKRVKVNGAFFMHEVGLIKLQLLFKDRGTNS